MSFYVPLIRKVQNVISFVLLEFTNEVVAGPSAYRGRTRHDLVAHQQLFDHSEGDIDFQLLRSLEQLKLLNEVI